MRIFTTEDLLEYLYNEASQKKSAAIKAALQTDWALREAFELMISGQKQLEHVNLSPSEDVLKRILDYADKAISQLHPH
ncbi:MAG: hypothetical protein ABJA71_14095 [Ginsengibacter sp.]